MFDAEKFGKAMGEAIAAAVGPLKVEIEALKKQLAELPAPVPGPKGDQGEPGMPGAKGEKGLDGVNLAGAMIDRDGVLQITLSNGEVKSLGPVVGKDGSDGSNGKDGTDGMSLENFEFEYLPESHEIEVKAVCAGRSKSLRYPAGGIRPAGYWRNGSKAKAGEAWVHDGSLYIALKDTQGIPQTKSEDWIIAARRGRDGDNVVRTVKPADPIKLGN